MRCSIRDGYNEEKLTATQRPSGKSLSVPIYIWSVSQKERDEKKVRENIG